MRRKKLKGKEWVEIVAPKFFGDIVIGETTVSDQEKVIGRTVESNVTEMTNDPSKYYVNLIFKVRRVRSGKAYTEFFGHNCTRDFLARIIRKWTSKVETNDIFQFKDKKVRIKTITITNRRVQKPVKRKIRKRIGEMLNDIAKKSTFELFIKDFISGKIQNKIKNELNKIYPIRVFEFRKSEVLE